jgi:hypothetical protein
MTEKDKTLPQVILQDVSRDSTTNMIIREKYILIQAQEPLDSLLEKAKKTLKEM